MVDNDSVDNLVNKMFESEEIDVNKVCRSCLLNTGDTTPMHHEYSRDLCVVDVFLSTTSLKFNADYPRQICSYCLSELNRSFDFISKCRESDRKLREYFDKIRTKENEVSVDIQLGNTANNLNINNSDTQGVTLHDIYMPDVEFALQIEQEIKLEENNTPNIASTNSLEDPLTIDEMQIDLETNVNFDIKTEHEHDYNELLSISPVDQIPVAHIEESHHETPPSYGKRNADRESTSILAMQRIVLELHANIKMLINKQDKLESLLAAKGIIFPEIDEIFEILPLKTDEDVSKIEAYLKESEVNRIKMVNILGMIGGETYGQAISLCMKKIFSKEMALKYSGCGKKGKLNFSLLNICKCLHKAIRYHFQYVTQYEMEKKISSCLALVRDRDGGRRAQN